MRLQGRQDLLTPTRSSGPSRTTADCSRRRRRRLHREPSSRRWLTHGHLRQSADDRSARRGAAAADGRQVRHRGVRVDRGHRRPRHLRQSPRRSRASRPRRAPPGELLEHGQPRGPGDDRLLPVRARRELPPRGGPGIVYDQSTQPQTLPADSTNRPVTAAVTGLVPNALYHIRLVATNATGTTLGPDQTFTTPADPPRRPRC